MWTRAGHGRMADLEKRGKRTRCGLSLGGWHPLTGFTLPGFPGQLQTLPDLYYNQHRDYDPTTGRYIQADPIGYGDGMNMYAYVGGDPVNFTDPLGLFAGLGGGSGAASGRGDQDFDTDDLSAQGRRRGQPRRVCEQIPGSRMIFCVPVRDEDGDGDIDYNDRNAIRRLLSACGCDPTGMTPSHRRLPQEQQNALIWALLQLYRDLIRSTTPGTPEAKAVFDAYDRYRNLPWVERVRQAQANNWWDWQICGVGSVATAGAGVVGNSGRLVAGAAGGGLSCLIPDLRDWVWRRDEN